MGAMGANQRRKDESSDVADAVDAVKGAGGRSSRPMKRARVTGERVATGEDFLAHLDALDRE